MDSGTLVLLRKHVVYLCIAAWHIITHFHIALPWVLVPVIFAFRVPYIEPTSFDLSTVLVSEVRMCTDEGFRTLVSKVQNDCINSSPSINRPKDYDNSTMLFDVKRCSGYLFFHTDTDAYNFMNTESGNKLRSDFYDDAQFPDAHKATSLIDHIDDAQVFSEYIGIASFILSITLVEVVFFMMREYFRWDTFVLRSPAVASCIAAARIAITIFLMFKAFKSFSYIKPALAAAGAIICAIIILIPVSIVTSRLPRGRLSSLFSYAVRCICTIVGVPLVWHIIFVEGVINPVAGPVFTDSTPSSMMMCFWFAGSIIGLVLHSSTDKQVRHIAPAISQQGLLFALDALRFTILYSVIQFIASCIVVLSFNFSEVILGEFGDFSFALVGRMFFATAFCTFLTCIGAQYLSACLDPHPSCSLSIDDARSLAGGVKASLYTGHVAYRAYHRVRIVAAAFLRWCRCNTDRALECAFRTSEIYNPMDPIKDSIIVDAFCCAIDGYSKDLQSVKAQFDTPYYSGQSIFLFNWFWHSIGYVLFKIFGHGPELSIVQSNAHSIAAAVRALSSLLAVADERVFTGRSVAVASALQPRVLLSTAIFVKAHTSIANLARDLGQLQRTLNDRPYQFSLQQLKPGDPAAPLKHPLTQQYMFPVDPRFIDVSDACHAALMLLRYSTRFDAVLTEMGKGSRDSAQAKRRLEFMSANSMLPPALQSFAPKVIKNHRLVSSQAKPAGRLSLSHQPGRNEVHALDSNLEYLVAFEGVPEDQDAWVSLPDGTTVDTGLAAMRYTELLLDYIQQSVS